MTKATKAPSEEAKGKKRVNLFIEDALLNKLDHIAGMEFSISQKKATRTDIVNDFLSDGVEKWEKKNGAIPIK